MRAKHALSFHGCEKSDLNLRELDLNVAMLTPTDESFEDEAIYECRNLDHSVLIIDISLGKMYQAQVLQIWKAIIERPITRIFNKEYDDKYFR